MEQYLVESSIALVILYGSYQLVIRFESNHQINRFLGLFCVLFSSVVYFIPVGNLFLVNESVATTYIISKSMELEEGFSTVIQKDTFSLSMMVYLAGLAIFSIRFFLGIGMLLRLFIISPRTNQWGFTVINVQRPQSTFTFFNWLFMGSQQHQNMETLTTHEQVHRDWGHSVDRLILEVFSILFWFNPFVWLFKKDIRNEHEYMADALVLKTGVDVNEYQHLLFQERMGISLLPGNELNNQASLKSRFIKMEQQQNNQRKGYLRTALVLQLIIVAMGLSSFAGILAFNEPDQLPVYKAGEKELYKFVGDNILYPKAARDANSSGMFYVSFRVNSEGQVEDVVAKKRGNNLLEGVVVIGYGTQSTAVPIGVNQVIENEAIRVVKDLGEFIPAQKNGKPVSTILNLPITYKLTDQ